MCVCVRALAAQAEGYSSKAVSCADGEAITEAFTTNDCTEPVGDERGSTTVECFGEYGIKQTVFGTSDCTGEPIDTIDVKFDECKNPVRQPPAARCPRGRV